MVSSMATVRFIRFLTFVATVVTTMSSMAAVRFFKLFALVVPAVAAVMTTVCLVKFSTHNYGVRRCNSSTSRRCGNCSCVTACKNYKGHKEFHCLHNAFIVSNGSAK
jgi:hypothetical protein